MTSTIGAFSSRAFSSSWSLFSRGSCFSAPVICHNALAINEFPRLLHNGPDAESSALLDGKIEGPRKAGYSKRENSSTPAVAISPVASLSRPPISAVAGRANWPSYRCAMLYRPVGPFSATHRVQVPDEVGLPGRARSWQRPKVFPEEISICLKRRRFSMAPLPCRCKAGTQPAFSLPMEARGRAVTQRFCPSERASASAKIRLPAGT